MALIGNFVFIHPGLWLFPTHSDVIDAKRRAKEWFERHGNYEGAEFVIEEFVRQWALKRLIDAYKYPMDWLPRRAGKRSASRLPWPFGNTSFAMRVTMSVR
jgi:type I restriction enzyme M protein